MRLCRYLSGPLRVRNQIRGLFGWGIGNCEPPMAAFAKDAGNG